MPRPNEKIGPYTLISKLGRGAFGVVWLAEKRSILATTKVALKLPHDDDVDLEAVKQEASLWVHASGHPNVLPIIDADIYDEQIVIVSEYAPDGSLSKWLQGHGGRAPSIETAVEMTLGILAGLEHLHEKGIIHRDIKPDNILLQKETPRLADFGIARILKSTSRGTGGLAGTPAYMPPEAFDGKRSVRADIWSVGVIFYQLLTGRLPFSQPDMMALMSAIITREPEPIPNYVPRPLQEIVKQSLEKSSEQRFVSAEAMFKSLRTATQSLTSMTLTNVGPPNFLRGAEPRTGGDATAVPTVPLLLELHAVSDVGRVLSGNEDNYLILDLTNAMHWTASEGEEPPAELRRIPVGKKGVVLAVSDGDESALAGDVASRMVVESIRDMLIGADEEEDYYEDETPLIDYVRRAAAYANLVVHNRSQEDTRCAGMSATLTAATVTGNVLDLVQVGNSRAYVIRNYAIKPVTKDQTLVQQLVDTGQISEEEAVTHPSRGVQLQSIGWQRELYPVQARVRMVRGDILILCTDGLSNQLHPYDMLPIVYENRDNLAEATRGLVNEALARGGHDNITVIVAKFDGYALPPYVEEGPVVVELPPMEDDSTLGEDS